jgi:uncharacterized membrane protein
VARRQTLAVIDDALPAGQEPVPAPHQAMPVAALRSGYLQAVNPAGLLEWAGRERACLRLHLRVGQHVVAGTTLALVWPVSADDPWPDPPATALVVDRDVRIGRERTFEQDAAFGIRQLVDVACKAMSPAVNDPYTAVQAVNNISVIFGRLATRPLGDYVAQDGTGATVVVPGRRFGDYLETMCGLVRRYGAREPIVAQALLKLLADCAALVGEDPDRQSTIRTQARLIVAEAERQVTEPTDLAIVYAEAAPLLGAPTDDASGG